jgi:C-terminal processing protease CtpA/Prc
MLRATREEIEKYYFDPKFGGFDLAQAYVTAEERVDRSRSLPDALSAIAQFAMDLRDSHTYFIPPRQTAKVDYGWTMQMIGDACYVVAVKPGSDAARQAVGVGDRVEAVNGYRPARNNLWQLRYMFQVLRPQPGLHVELLSVNGVARELDLAAAVKPRPSITDLYSDGGLQQVATEFERFSDTGKSLFVTVEPDVLVWKLPSFSVEEHDIASGIRMAQRGKALILDLRGNGGGAESMLLALVGALNRQDVTVGKAHGREGDKPLIARGAGASAYDGRLVVLVDSWSASASELLARTVQLTSRGTVLGDHTAGSVMEGRFSPMSAAQGEYRALFGIVVTKADILMSDGGRLERVGVTPDVEILPSTADLAGGRDPALAKALELLGHPTDAKHAGALLQGYRDAHMRAD